MHWGGSDEREQAQVSSLKCKPCCLLGCPADQQDEDGHSALQVSCTVGHVEVAQALGVSEPAGQERLVSPDSEEVERLLRRGGRDVRGQRWGGGARLCLATRLLLSQVKPCKQQEDR